MGRRGGGGGGKCIDNSTMPMDRDVLMTTSLVPHYISQHIAISCVRVIARECVLYAEHSMRGGVENLSHKRYHKEQRCRLPVLYGKIQHWRCAFDAPTQNTISGIIYIYIFSEFFQIPLPLPPQLSDYSRVLIFTEPAHAH